MEEGREEESEAMAVICNEGLPTPSTGLAADSFPPPSDLEHLEGPIDSKQEVLLNWGT